MSYPSKGVLFFSRGVRKRLILSIEKVVLEMVNKYARELEIAQENNFSSWHLLGQKEVWPNYYIGNSHQEEVVYLQNWILERGNWLDKKWGN